MTDTPAPFTGEKGSTEGQPLILDFGPDTWTENGTDGVVTSITVLIKGWRHSQLSYSASKVDENGDTYTPLDFKATAEVQDSFTWNVPAEHQTSKVWHNHTHPHDDENDEEYNAKMIEWQKLIPQESEYQTILANLENQLKSL